MGVYKWKEGSRFSGNAQEIGDWLTSINEKTPENIVNEAEDEASPGHDCFTWADAKAAHHWRLQEARMLVNAVITVSDAPDRDPIDIPAFESVVIGEQRQYVPVTVESLSDDDIWLQITGESKALLKQVRHKMSVYGYIRKEQAERAQEHLELAEAALK